MPAQLEFLVAQHFFQLGRDASKLHLSLMGGGVFGSLLAAPPRVLGLDEAHGEVFLAACRLQARATPGLIPPQRQRLEQDAVENGCVARVGCTSAPPEGRPYGRWLRC